MKIKKITLKYSHLPLKEPFTTALRSVETIDEIILIIDTQAYQGLGSAPATLAVTGDDLESIASDINNIIIPAFLHYDLDDYEQTFQKLSRLDICKSAQTAVDIALHDLFAKEKNQPLYEYLQGKSRPLQTLYTISINSPEKMLAQAQEAFHLGFTKLKVKLDKQLELNIKRIQHIHKNLTKAELFLDINQAFNYQQTQELMIALKEFPITLLEQPLPAHDLKGMSELTRANILPILADETVFSYNDALKAIEFQACHYINIKLMKCGGIYEAKKILELCQEKEMKCMMGSMLESGISVTAALHLAFAYKNVIFADLDGPTLARERIITGGITYDAMNISLDNKIGLGITL